MLNRRYVLVVYSLLAAVFSGCGPSAPKLYPVSGTVTYEGKPVEGATVLFIPQAGRPSVGFTDASGKYTIATGGKPGVPLGTYNVTVAKQEGAANPGGSTATELQSGAGEPPSREQVEKIMGQQQMGKMIQEGMMKKSEAKSALPTKYAIPEGSGLSAPVTADKLVFDFDLKP